MSAPNAPSGLDGLTPIAAAAVQIGVSERTLRRVLKEPELQARLVASARHGTGRYRQSLMLPPALVAELRDRFRPPPSGRAGADAPEPAGPDTGDNTGAPVSDTGNVPADTGITQATLAGYYERLLSEREARIGELTAQVERLDAALRREQENLAREQSLRLLGMSGPAQIVAEPAQQSEAPAEDVPAPEPEAPDLSAGAPQDGDRPEARPLTPPGPSPGAVGPKSGNDVPAAKAAHDVSARPGLLARIAAWWKD